MEDMNEQEYTGPTPENPNAVVSKEVSGKDAMESEKEPDEFEILKEKAKTLTEDDFVPMSDGYGNELCLYAEDMESLASEERGSEFMMVIRGAVKGINKCGEEPKLELYVWDGALIHGKKSMRLGMGGRFQAIKDAIMRKGKSASSAEAIAASIGRKTLGKSHFQNLAAKGLRRYFKNK